MVVGSRQPGRRSFGGYCGAQGAWGRSTMEPTLVLTPSRPHGIVPDALHLPAGQTVSPSSATGPDLGPDLGPHPLAPTSISPATRRVLGK